MVEIPDSRWYARISEERNVTIRCPYATVEACPRYYQSLSLLGEVGSTKIPKPEDERLLKRWEKSDLWPRTREYATSVSGASGNPKIFSNFCPEVTYDRFGFFATDLTRYGDEIDSGVAHEQLRKERAPSNDPRWLWASSKGQHYTECPIYAVLSNRNKSVDISSLPKPEPWWRKHLTELILALIVAVIGAVVAKLFA